MGGHASPISMFGAVEDWKNAQNSEMNSIISETINRIIPVFKVNLALAEWAPSFFDSLKISILHNIEVRMIAEIAKRFGLAFFVYINTTVEVVRAIAAVEAAVGQGLGLTM